MKKEGLEIYRLIGLTMSYHALGQSDESDAMLEELIEKYGQEQFAEIASVMIFRGDADNAFEWLEKGVSNNDPNIAWIHVGPLFAKLHDDRRWVPLLDGLGKSPDQLSAIEFNVTLPN